MFKQTGIIFLAAILLAGCSTEPTTLEETHPPPAATNENSSLNWSAPGPAQKPVAPIAITNAPVTIRTNLPSAAIPKPAPVPVVTWTSLNDWAAAHEIGVPRLLSKSPATTYAMGSSNGVIVVSIGSLGATWNGIEINLGFEPQFIDGEIFLHGLDLQKNLEPLLCEPPLTFGTNRIIVIDPGHGGDNHGTTSVLDGRFEKEFTLDWAKRLKPLLETNGWKVFLTRTNDTYMGNSNRVDFAEAHHADLFISLHFNAAEKPDPKVGGLETYCITPIGMPSTLTRGFADPWFESLPNNHFDAQNLQLAVKLHTAILRATGIEDRGVRRSRFDTVLRGQSRPAILIEGGYLSNPAEAKLIESADYRQKLAEAVAAALK